MTSFLPFLRRFFLCFPVFYSIIAAGCCQLLQSEAKAKLRTIKHFAGEQKVGIENNWSYNNLLN